MNLEKTSSKILFFVCFITIFCVLILFFTYALKPKSNIDIFEKAIDVVLKNEGLYVNDVDDKGGETKFGISKRSYPNLDIKNLSLEKAKEIYKKDFWENQKYKNIKNIELAIKIFDLSVNVGVSRANKLIQRALRAVNKKVEENGVLNDVVIHLINESDSSDLLSSLKSEAAGYYRSIVLTKPHRAKFLKGWLNRAYE